MAVHWGQDINFTSALLLHSCLTLLIKEALNLAALAHRLALRQLQKRRRQRRSHVRGCYCCGGISDVASSLAFDAYTSVLCNDPNGAMAELYYTSTGLALLGVSLASAVVMNLWLSDLTLNVIVAATFGLTWVASMAAASRWRLVLPLLALRRAGRFVWSDTPFVNFFSLIYIATALDGSSTLHLRDYVILRCVAIAELVFMKVLIAATDVDGQQAMLRALIASEKTVIRAESQTLAPSQDTADKPQSEPELLNRHSIVAFTTVQRMCVMFFKTMPGFDTGSVRGPLGPLRIPVPAEGEFVDDGLEWKMYRIARDVMVIADNLQPTLASGPWERLIGTMHGVLLRRLGKVRVVYLVRQRVGEEHVWKSNMNLVTGVTGRWLETFHRGEAVAHEFMM